MINYVPIKHKQMPFMSNGGKFKIYTVLNGLLFPKPTQSRISFERAILVYKIFVCLFICLYPVNLKIDGTIFFEQNFLEMGDC
jgi:hypothetical protein